MEKVSNYYHITIVQELFHKVFLKYTDEKTTNKLFSEVFKRYSKKNRHYHNMHHIQGMCSSWDLFKSQLKNQDAIFFAIIYHDIIYNPLKSDNEEKSSDYFRDKVANLLKLDITTVVKVCDAILATKHNEDSKELWKNDLDIQYFLDFDLHILGTRHESEYEWYRKGVRKEYRIYPNFMYKPGRKKVLENFLNRKNIYLTKDFQVNEKRARKNLKNEINLYLC